MFGFLNKKNKPEVKTEVKSEAHKKREYEGLTDEENKLVNSRSAIRMHMEILNEKFGWTYADALHEIQKGEKYGFNPRFMGVHGLFGATEEEMMEAHDRMKETDEIFTDMVAEVSGWDMDTTKMRLEHAMDKYGMRPKRFYSRMLYLYDEDEMEDVIQKGKERNAGEVQWAMARSGWTKYELAKHRRYCQMKFGIDSTAYYSTRCWQFDDETLATFANIRDTEALRDKYNNKEQNRHLTEKVQFDETFNDLIGRKYWVNRDTTFENFQKFTEGLDEIFCKPINLSHATGARKEKIEGDLHELYDRLMDEPMILFEECVRQHHEMNEFYDGSVNTIRITCILDNDKFFPFAAFARFGAGGVADNIVAGGVGCGIDINTGTINTPAIDRFNEFHDTHPVSGKRFEGFKIPNWDKVLEIAEKGIRRVPGINFAGWDIAVTEDGAVLIEGNSLPSFSTYQMFYCLTGEGKKYEYERFLTVNQSER